MNITRNNHYVPQWYQKRFLSSDSPGLYYLDLIPPLIKLPNGEKKVLNGVRGPFTPSRCFFEKDLYTINFSGLINDEIERYLFGEIDRVGVRAVDAMAKQEFKSLHDNFENFFEYIDIQKIRTPKGLAWIKSKYPGLTHNQLLIEMQRIRQLHCIMWVESVREIVSASTSKIKFIVSDHPTTVYNWACPPSSQECAYPNDPRIEMKATQTVFPLDSNHCLILTNLDYARNPELEDPRTYRPNPNPYRPTRPVRIDNTICKRELNENEVASINLIIKARAKRFIASENREWLYPEKNTGMDWIELGKVLLPPQQELHHYSGEIYVGYKDGTTSYHDEYGRTHGELDYLKKKIVEKELGPNDPCGCGNGKKYKKCCSGKPKDERSSWTVRSIRERNIRLIKIIIKILGFDKNKDWIQIRRELTDKKIADIHKAVAALWPPETDLMSLLPRPNPEVSRALYSGLLDPRVAYMNVAVFLFLADEVLILNPFMNPNIIRKEYNPIDNPASYRQETLKNVIFLITLMPLIVSGRVNVIPDPLNFNPGLRQQLMVEAEKRRHQTKIDEKTMAPMRKMAKEDAERFLFNLSDDDLRRFIEKKFPEIGKDQLDKTIEYMKTKRDQDPYAVLQSDAHSEHAGQMLSFQLNPNLEMGMFLAQATGAFICTNHSFRWQEICSSVNYFYGEYKAPWEKLAKYISDLEIDIIHFREQEDFLEVLNNQDLGFMRVALKNVWNAVQMQQPCDQEEINGLINQIDQANGRMSLAIDKILKKMNQDCKEYLRVVKGKAKISSQISPAGHSTSAVYRFLLAHAGHDKYLKSLPLSLYVQLCDEIGSNADEVV